MAQNIDPKEVLTYLNELGYTNITAQQLKEFIKDLKKLVKYDSRYGGDPESITKDQEFCSEESEYCECEYSGNDICDNDKENETNADYSRNNTQKVEAFKSKQEQKDKHIAVHIYDTKNPKKLLHDHCVHINQLNAASADTNSTKLKSASHVCTCGTSKPETTESTIRSIQPSSTREFQSRASSRERKSKVTFIRPAIARPSINKCDPVALYHYYQSEWKRSKIPGQDNRDDLRWAIREKMLSGPRVEVRSRCNIQRCGWSR